MNSKDKLQGPGPVSAINVTLSDFLGARSENEKVSRLQRDNLESKV